MNVTLQTEERSGPVAKQESQTAQESVTHEGEPMMNESTVKATPSADELCMVMSDLAGFTIETVGDMIRFSFQVGIEPSELLTTAQTIATIEAHLQAGGQR